MVLRFPSHAVALTLPERIAGILAPVFALRGKDDLGIGDTAAMIEFIDWAARHGFGLVKILPINETGGDHSPYNAISSHALDPTTIHVDPEVRTDEDRIAEVATEAERVDYSTVKPLKSRLLAAAFESFESDCTAEASIRRAALEKFSEEEAEWLRDYTLFRVLMERNGGSECWDQWDKAHRSPREAQEWLARLPAEQQQAVERRRRFFAYVQWIAFAQWEAVKEHAEKRGVAVMGDIPFGVSYYSVDVWSRRELFQIRWSGGTPPDKFFKHDPFVQKWGQNWGVPLYDWEAMRRDSFQWWRDRIRGVRRFFDLFRIDHVLGFYRVFAFPWRPERNEEFLPLDAAEAQAKAGGEIPRFLGQPDDTPAHRAHNRSHGEEILKVIVSEAGEGRVVGEDLGEVPKYVRPSLKSLGIAGYKIPAWERDVDGRWIPASDYEHLSLVTYGTHDHEPLRVTWEKLVAEAVRSDNQEVRVEMREFCRYVGLRRPPSSFTPELHEALLRTLFASNSWLAVVMITDLFGRTERFNLPGVGSGNWTQRIHRPIAELDAEPIVMKIRGILESGLRCGASADPNRVIG